jgi:Leucine-rich repeat (LRR) protein
MKELKELDLSHCKVTDEGLAALRGHPNLRQLWLDQTQITDASIDLLLSLPKLERLSIEGSGISDQGKKTIFTKKPYLKR